MFTTKLKIVAALALSAGIVGGGSALAEQPEGERSGANADRPDKKSIDERERTLLTLEMAKWPEQARFAVELQIAELLQRVGPEHPDVLALKKRKDLIEVFLAQHGRVQVEAVQAPKDLASPAKKKELSVVEAEAQLERLLKVQALGAVAEADVDQARIAVAEARVARELRAIVELRQKEVDRARKLLDAKVITTEEHKKAVDALDAAKRRVAE
jgi:hypothetical protein